MVEHIENVVESVVDIVAATILAFGTEDETREYCEKLVTMGMGGGFMLSSGCEVPINAKLENLKAFVNFLKN